MKKRILFFFFLFLILTGTSHFYASAQVVLNKSKVKVRISPGKTISGSITVTNNSKVPLPLKAYFEDFLYVPPYDGTKKFLPVGSTEHSCGEWINFSPQEFIIPAFSKREINYVIKVPHDISGGYYGVLFFQKAPELSPEVPGLEIIVRVGCLFFLEAESRTKEASLKDVFAESGCLKLYFANQGSTILVASSVFYIMDAEGMVIDRGEAGNFYLPPKEKALFSIPVSKNLSPGKYILVLTFDLGERDVLVKEIDFSKDSRGNISILEVRD